MVVGEHGGGRREIDRLPQTNESPRHHELPKPSTKSRHDRHQAPEETPTDDQTFARPPITGEPGKGSRGGIDPHEGTPDQTELRFRESVVPLQQGKKATDGLSVGVVEEANQPEHPKHDPFFTVGGGWA